jgi:hypothetical protein
MKIKEFFPWLVGLFVLLAPATPALAGGPLLVVSDLEPQINILPRRCACDPIVPLIIRLEELRHADPDNCERQALEQALSLIQIFRKTRISSASVH